MKWLKYRHTWASHAGEWEWTLISLDAITREHAESLAGDMEGELMEEFLMLDHYRGVDSEICDIPPEDVLLEKIGEVDERIDFLTKRKKEYAAIVRDHYPPPKA